MVNFITKTLFACPFPIPPYPLFEERGEKLFLNFFIIPLSLVPQLLGSRGTPLKREGVLI